MNGNNKKINWQGLNRDLRFYLSRALDSPLVKPRNVTLNLTYRCNQKCIMCSIRKDDIDHNVELTLPEIKDIINQVAEWGIPEIVFTGGEPLILKDIFTIIDYAAGKGVRPVLITNCFCSKNTIMKLKNPRISHIQVSVDGVNAKTHDFIRRSKGSFNVTLDNIKELVSVKHRQYSVNATVTIMDQNVSQLMDIAVMMKKIGIDKLSIRPVHIDNTNPLATGKKDVSYWIPEERLSILNEQMDKLSNYNDETGFIDCRPGFEYIKEYYRKGYITPTNSCYNGYNRVIIAYNEHDTYEIWMCKGMIGDIKKKRLRTLWFSRRARKVRKAMRKCVKSCAFPSCYEPGLENVLSIIRKNIK